MPTKPKSPTSKGHRYTFFLGFGYAESQSLAYLPFTSTGSFSNARDALVDLAMFLREQYDLRNAPEPPRECCLGSAKGAKTKTKYCAVCGLRLSQAAPEFDPDRYMGFVREMWHCDLNSFHGEYIEWDESHRWQANAGSAAIRVRFVHTAEKVLAAAIGHSPDSRVTFESICKDRTASKSENFSFW